MFQSSAKTVIGELRYLLVCSLKASSDLATKREKENSLEKGTKVIHSLSMLYQTILPSEK
jgi:hypothetical protein